MPVTTALPISQEETRYWPPLIAYFSNKNPSSIFVTSKNE